MLLQKTYYNTFFTRCHRRLYILNRQTNPAHRLSARPEDDDCVVATEAEFEFTLGNSNPGSGEGNATKLAAFKWKKQALSDTEVTAMVFLAHGYAGTLFSSVV